MDDERTLHTKPRAVRKLMDYYSCDESSRPWLNTSDSDTSQSDGNNRSPVPSSCGRARCGLPPIGVFWDIENCQIPRGRSAVAVSQAIRDKFFDGYREAEFLVVCDVKKETSQVIQELNDAQVNLIHVGSQSKNAADEKLRQSIRRFADLHGSQAAIVLISGDINFAPDLCDLRHRKKIHVILVHNDMCSESLMLCANEHYRFSDLVASLPFRGAIKSVPQPAEVTVSSLPVASDPAKVRTRLRRLAENCGGRVSVVLGEIATIRFPSIDFAIRAQRRMDGEKVFGSQISVSYPTIVREAQSHGSPLKGLNNKLDDRSQWSCLGSSPPTQPLSQGTGPYRRVAVAPPNTYYNQENIPNWNNFNMVPPHIKDTKQAGGRPILGRGEDAHSGRHSLDSYLSDARPNSDQVHGRRLCRTPSPPSLPVNLTMPPPPIVNLPRSSNSQVVLQPIAQRPSVSEPVEVLVTQLDRAVGQLELKRQLTAIFKQHSPVVSVSVFVGPDGVLAASVKLHSLTDASRAIHQLQGLRVGASHIHLQLPEPGYCVIHSHSLRAVPQSEPVRVNVRLADFSTKLTHLVSSHDNNLPLASLADCYAAQYEPLTRDTAGVTLEQLVSWVPAVHLTPAPKHLRLFTPEQERGEPTGPEASLGQELVVLLRLQPRCEAPLRQLAPLYQHHFGRPLQLPDTLARLSHYIQVVGEGGGELVTLAPRVQLQRFTADLLRVLRGHPNRRLTLAALPPTWKLTTGQVLSAVEYGLCHLDDLLGLVSATDVVISGEGPQRVLAIGRRNNKQTKPQPAADKIKQFSDQVVALLSQSPQFTLELAKFVPAYHSMFRIQCCVADYGFTKLSDLFNAIPNVVQMEVVEGERRVVLTPAAQLKVLGERLTEMVRGRRPDGLRMDSLHSAYLWQYGQPLQYSLTQLTQLLNKIPNIKVDGSGVLTVCDDSERLRVLRVLWDRSSAKMSLPEFHQQFTQHYPDHSPITLHALQNDLKEVVKVTEEGQIQLRPLQLFARDVHRLLCAHEGRLALNVFEAEFRRTLGTAVCPDQYGHASPADLLAAISHVVTLSGRGPKRVLTLNPRLADVGICLPNDVMKNGTTGTVNGNFANSKKPVVNGKVDSPKAKGPELMLMSPDDMLLPRASLSFHPPPPDPSTLPRPRMLSFTQSQQARPETRDEEYDVYEQSKRRLRLAAHFRLPIQLQ